MRFSQAAGFAWLVPYFSLPILLWLPLPLSSLVNYPRGKQRKIRSSNRLNSMSPWPPLRKTTYSLHDFGMLMSRSLLAGRDDRSYECTAKHPGTMRHARMLTFVRCTLSLYVYMFSSSSSSKYVSYFQPLTTTIFRNRQKCERHTSLEPRERDRGSIKMEENFRNQRPWFSI